MRQERLAAFVEWCRAHVRGDEKGEAQVFLDHLFRAFAQPGAMDVGGREGLEYAYLVQLIR